MGFSAEVTGFYPKEGKRRLMPRAIVSVLLLISLGLAQSAHSAPLSQKDDGKNMPIVGSVAAKTFVDVDCNGVMEEEKGEEPIPGVAVTIIEQSGITKTGVTNHIGRTIVTGIPLSVEKNVATVHAEEHPYETISLPENSVLRLCKYPQTLYRKDFSPLSGQAEVNLGYHPVAAIKE